MDAIVAQAHVSRKDPDASPGAVLAAARYAQLYHFLELALSHPGPDGFEYFRTPGTEDQFKSALASLPGGNELKEQAAAAAGHYFACLRQRSFEDVEAEHIGLFSSNFPTVPCPPYGSLFTVDENKRLEEMLAIKQFYHRSGVDVAASFDDLPDHICVEIEFLQLLCFRLDDALRNRDPDMATGLANTQTIFLDRFLLPFARRLARIATGMAPENSYAHLLTATRAVIEHHRQYLELAAVSSPAIPERS